MLIIKFLLNFLKLLNKAGHPGAIAAGLALGMVWGFVPKMGVMGLAVLLVILVVNVNFSASLAGAALFSAVAWALDPVFNRVGYALLMAPALRGFWTALYNTPVVPWTRFNNTLVLGGLATGLALFLPAYFLFRWGIVTYRERILAVTGRWKIVQALKATKIFSLLHDYL